MKPSGNNKCRSLELLAPAADAEVAIQAILHGADAVYMGGPHYGARKNAANSIDEIRRVAEFAHIFRARLYVTFNTILFDSELNRAEKMIGDLYRAGVDALIVQDMGILRMDIPPIALHASTQCDIRTPEKARFLQDVGMSQLVLARELTLPEIRAVVEAVEVPVETFVHGALCVCYSGRCHASEAITGRSANRGECSQLCRLRYRLQDADGRNITTPGHLLSLRDFNASDRLENLIDAGASSFKIEGRLKDAAYVKNVTAYYRGRLDEIIRGSDGKFRRSSFGSSEISFTPELAKSFNRGFTHYFLDRRRPTGIWEPRTPKSLGETITDPGKLHNGDGISYFDASGEYTGVIVNGIKNGRIIGNRDFRIPKGEEIHRTSDIEWQKAMGRDTARRTVDFDVSLDAAGVSAVDERGCEVRLPIGFESLVAEKECDLSRPFGKTGGTHYRLGSFMSRLPQNAYIPPSVLTEVRRQLLAALEGANRATYGHDMRRPEIKEAKYPYDKLTFADNVANRLAGEFYREHGVTEIEPAMETLRGKEKVAAGTRVMTTRHCILRELGRCRREKQGKGIRLPLTLKADGFSFRLDFDCEACEMHVSLP